MIICTVVYAYLFFSYRWAAREYLKIPSGELSTDDCRWEAKQLASFVYGRYSSLYDEAFIGCKTGAEHSMFLYEGHELTELVRLAHQAGCRIVIKKVADHDIENPRVTREHLEKHHMKLRRQRDERLDAKYSRR